jgi:hypothetical protein
VIGGRFTDQVDILFQFERTISLSHALKAIKFWSSAWVDQTRGLSHPFHWQSGHGEFSVSQSNIEAVKKYIRHHTPQSFQDELRERLRRFGVDWGEW